MTNPPKNPAAVSLGRLGGKAGSGPAKARTKAQATAAVQSRWAKHRARLAAIPNEEKTKIGYIFP